jgi:pimeloyl-ACP methyl ester carboxylesterase
MATTPVYILPGLLLDSDCYEHQITRLRESTGVSVADLTASDSIAGLARDALEQAPARRFALAGHSMGGYVAFEILRQAPERVERLALFNTNARADSPEAAQNRRRLMELAEKDFPAVIQALMPRLMRAEALADPDKSGTIGAMALAIGKEAFVRQENAVLGRIDSRPHLAKIACPTLVVAGREDAIMPLEFLEEIARGVPKATLAVIERCGHMPSLERPEELTELLVSWLEQ